MEVILEAVLEFFMECAVNLPKRKWVKTVLFLFITQFFSAVLIWMTVDVWQYGLFGFIFCLLLIVLWIGLTLYAAVIGHKRNLNKDQEQ